MTEIEKLSGKTRFEGFKQLLKDHNINLPDCFIGYGDFTEPSGYQAMKSILQYKLPTAVFVCNDTMAIGAYKAIRESNLKIPQDISIVGFDNIKISEYMSSHLLLSAYLCPKLQKLLQNYLYSQLKRLFSTYRKNNSWKNNKRIL